MSSMYAIGLSALNNAQVAVNSTSNNIANADTVGYQRTIVNYETNLSTTQYGVQIGTGASISGIEAQFDVYVEDQFLDAQSEMASYSAQQTYTSQLDSLFNQSEDLGLATLLDSYWDAWRDVSTDPATSGVRVDLLSTADQLADELQSTSEQLDSMTESIEDEIRDQVSQANDLINEIAALNQAVMQSTDDNTVSSQLDQAIRDLDALIGVDVVRQESGQITVYTADGLPLVEGDTVHELSYNAPYSTEALQSDSLYDGALNFSGESGSELLIEFVSDGPDGSAQFKVSLDGGQTWETDESGSTKLYTADDEDNAATVAGVDVWFDGTAAHSTGDRYTIVPKTSLGWTTSTGSNVNITPLSDENGDAITGRASSGSLAGLFAVRDETMADLQNQLDTLASEIIWQTNLEHSQGSGQTAHTSLTGSYGVDDPTAALADTDLAFADRMEAGTISFAVVDSDGTFVSNASISFDPATDSLDDFATNITAAFGGELTASVNSDGELLIDASGTNQFEITGDDTGALAALGLNTFFTGTDASSIAINSNVADDTSHINAGVSDDEGNVSSGSNTVAAALAEKGDETIAMGNDAANSISLNDYMAQLVTEAGSADSNVDSKYTYWSTSAEFYQEQQDSISGVNVDEELIKLTKYQQQYEAASRILTTMQEMIDTALGML